MRPTNEQRMEALRARRAQIDAELSQLEAQARQNARKIDTRKKILIGAVILQETEENPKLADIVNEILDKRLTKERDRKLFNLPIAPPANGQVKAPANAA